jgi:tetratricopeptide (TPR) repeat protein
MRQALSIGLVIAAGFFVLHPGGANGQVTTSAQTTNAESPDLAEAERLSAQVVKLYQEEKIAEALPLAKRALKLREKALGQSHRRVADAAGNLAVLYIATQKFDDAEQQLKRAVAIYEKEPEKDSLILAKALESLASLHTLKREFSKAENSYLRALSIREKTLGAQHLDLIEPLNQLADVYRRQQDHKKRVLTLERAAAIAGAQPGDKKSELGIALQRLACAQYKNNELQAAEATEAQANHILYGEAAGKREPLTLEKEAFDCRIITNPRPEFPPAARGRFTGSIKLEVGVEVDETGKVTSAVMTSGDPLFRKSTEKAAMGVKLRPMIVDGRPVRVKGVILHEYSLMSTTVLVPATRRP